MIWIVIVFVVISSSRLDNKNKQNDLLNQIHTVYRSFIIYYDYSI